MILAVMACWYIAGAMPQTTQCGVLVDNENTYVNVEACQMYVDDLQAKFPELSPFLKINFGCFSESIDKKKIPGMMKQSFNPVKVDG